ncbi:MAG: hypothetical protein PF448_13010 [Bacteroidales bacterium]|jgi:hypothetical protein|nr:hypothetical protein [Bacteroidales bacterium]
MASGIITSIQLDPFYQRFLRNYFEHTGIVFEFPKNHELSKVFCLLLTRPPLDPEPRDVKKEWEFKIDIPFMQHKNVMYNHYISARANISLAKKIHEFYMLVAHEELIRFRNQGFQHTECIDLFIDKYNLWFENYDRVLKDWQRYRNRIYQRKFSKKSTNLSA